MISAVLVPMSIEASPNLDDDAYFVHFVSLFLVCCVRSISMQLVRLCTVCVSLLRLLARSFALFIAVYFDLKRGNSTRHNDLYVQISFCCNRTERV